MLRLWVGVFAGVFGLCAAVWAETTGEAPAGVSAGQVATEADASAKIEQGSPADEASASETPVVSSPRIAAAGVAGERVQVQVIPIRDVIAKPAFYVLRRGLKEAQAAGVRVVVIDMETPGGELGTTLEIMEALDKFDGETLVYVNKEAISAGAIISSVTDEIHFAPGGVIGAAAAVNGDGEEIAATMRQKINSYLNAKVRSFSAGKTHRAEVIRAMMDSDYEFKIGETVIKPKGELLSLTDEEAAKRYGDPELPLLSAGTHKTLEDLLDSKYGANGYTVSRLEVTWSEELASGLSVISPLLMGLGMLCIFVELKTPGFGVFGIAGGLMLAVVFLGHYSAGLSGHEPALFFVLGVVLVIVELFVFPGILVAGIVGAALMLGSLVWSMIDVWPGEMPAFDGETLFTPLLNLVVAIGVACIGALALARFIPRGWFWDKMILTSAIAGDAGAPVAGMGGSGPYDSEVPEGGDGLLGARGRTASAMRPMGEVEIAGRRHEARAALGALERGQSVRVVGRSGRTLIVEADAA